MRKPRDIPQAILEDFEDALQEISCAFYDFRYKPIGKQYWIEQQVVPYINEAQSYLSSALDKDVKDLDYFQYVIKFRDIIFSICYHFKDYNL